jgi:hypothetical protein
MRGQKLHISDFRLLNADYKINRRGAKGKGQDKRIKVKRKDKEEMLTIKN